MVALPPHATAEVDTIVHGGRIVTAADVYEAAVAIRGEKIVAIGPPEVLPPAARTIDARGKYVLPGATDGHIPQGPEYAARRGSPHPPAPARRPPPRGLSPPPA